MATRRRTQVWAMGAVAVAVVMVTTVLGFGLGHRGALASGQFVQRPAPTFVLPGLDRRAESTVRLAKLRGHVVVVNFWASWCAECRSEQAALNRTWQRFRDSGVVVVGVNFQDAAGDARQYAATSGGSYPVVSDSDSSAALAYGIRGVPETYVVDPKGRLVDRFVGPVTYAQLSPRINDVLSKGDR